MRLISCVVVSALALFASIALGVEPRLDGIFDEWTPGNQIATDPAGDSSGAFDVRNVFAASRGTRLFLRFDIGAVLNVQSGNAGDGTLHVQIDMPNNRHLTIDTRNRRLWRDNNSGLTVTWATVGYSTAPSYAASEFELSVDLGSFGVVVGDTIDINFASSDSLGAPVSFVMTDPAPVPLRRSASRAAGTIFRVASVNTEQSGLINGSRAPRLLRLVDSMNADIYCFQEEYNSTAAQVDSAITSVDPLEDGANWNVNKNNDCAIASRSPLLAIPPFDTWHAAAIVQLGSGHDVAVFSIHPKCCGYIGSSEDGQRISQMNNILAELANLRNGLLGPAYLPYRDAPAVIIGDWNIVGSRTPLDMVTNPAGPGLTDAVPAQLIGEDVTTWRGTSFSPGSFTPGRIDLIAYDTVRGLTLPGSFVLDSQTLNSTELASLGLLATDSAATDHNMLVVDFAFAAPPPVCDGDADGDLMINFSDATSVLANWGSSGPLGDADHNGIVDFADVISILGNFGGPCP